METVLTFGHAKRDVYRAAIEFVAWAYRFCEALAGHRNAQDQLLWASQTAVATGLRPVGLGARRCASQPVVAGLLPARSSDGTTTRRTAVTDYWGRLHSPASSRNQGSVEPLAAGGRQLDQGGERLTLNV
jgi:hypothetical protein